MPSHFDVTFAQAPRDDGQFFFGLRELDPQEVINPFLDGDMRLGFELQIALLCVCAEVLFERRSISTGCVS